MKVEVHLGIVWAYKVTGGWYARIRAFPEAVTKKGDPDPSHPQVMKYVKEHA